jgi:SM-20-related protein
MKLMPHQVIINAMSFPTLQKSISTVIENIAQQGYAVIEQFMSHKEIASLAKQAKILHSTGNMHRAKTGISKVENSTLRGDFIHWIEADEASEAVMAYLNTMTDLQQAINQAFFLGLFELESHFAIYPPGAGYQKHLDQFIGKEERKISCILYLNEGWHHEDGGQLRMYLDKKDERRFMDINPQAGTLVVFLSSDFLHEVLPATRERISLTGWFRTRSLNS